jgi:hypothetical protein
MSAGTALVGGGALVLGFVIGAVLVLALSHHSDAWHFDWRLRIGRESERMAPGRPERPLERSESHETASGGMSIADDPPAAT